MQTELVPSYQFQVYVKKNVLKFSKISNIEQECEVEEFSVGGINGAPHMSMAPSKKSGRLILERGVVLKEDDIGMWRAGYYLQGPIDIFVYHHAGQKDFSKNYSVLGGMIVKWELTQLDAMSSELLIQKFEIAHCGFL